MPADNKKRVFTGNQELVRTVVVVFGFLVGGGFLFELIRDMGRLEAKVEYLEKEAERREGGTTAASVGESDGVFDEAQFQQEVLAEVQYLVGKISRVQTPGFVGLDQDAKEHIVKCLMFNLATWRISQRCLSAKQDFLDFGCVDEATGTVIRVPAEVKTLAAFCVIE